MVYDSSLHDLMNDMVSSNSSRSKERSHDIAESPSWRALLKDFSQDTTLHGIRYVTLDTRFVYIRRLFWLLIIGTAMGVFVFYAVDRLNEYLQFRTTSSVSETYVDSMAFPAITICNQNPFLLTAADTDDWVPVARMLTQELEQYTARTCYEGEFMCANLECIPSSYYCDSFPDCTDSSDETACNPCPSLDVSSRSSSEGVERITRGSFRLQENTFPSLFPVYIKSMKSFNMFLYFDENTDRWSISSNVGGGMRIPFAYAEDLAETPQDVVSVWTLESGETVDLQFTCGPPAISPDVNLGVPNGSLSLEYLYTRGAQPLRDLLIECYWRGEPCDASSFETVYTDMGVCYTFKRDDLTVYNSGPYSGMTVTLNIEQYDYTSDPADGSGVQILMHAPSDVPIMSTGSLAISPGLFSMVALERTQVDNLEAPWGNCSSAELTYYDSYSANTCIMDCKTRLALEKCGCLDINMPRIHGSVPYCSVDQYTRCIEVELSTSVVTEACPCGTPCSNIVYVPSLSFASITTDDSSINTQDSATAEMQERLARAREVAYRVDAAKFRDTTRIMNIIDWDLTRLLMFLEVLQEQVLAMTEDIMATAVDVGTDCFTFSTAQHLQAQQFTGAVERAINKFLSFYDSAVHGRLLNFRDVITELTESFLASEAALLYSHDGWLTFSQQDAQIEVTGATMSIRNISLWSDLNNGTYHNADFEILSTDSILNATEARVYLPDASFWNSTTEIWVRFNALRAAYQGAVSALNASIDPHYLELDTAINSIEDMGYAFRDILLGPISPLLRVQCDWCSTPDNDTLTGIVKKMLRDFSTVTLLPTLEGMAINVHDIYVQYLDALAMGDEYLRHSLIDDDLNALLVQADNLYLEIEVNMYDTLKTTRNFVEEILRQLTPKCEIKLMAIQSDIQITQERLSTLVDDMYEYVTKSANLFRENSRSYMNESVTLAQLSNTVAFAEMLSYVQPRIASAQDLLRTREIQLQTLENQVNNLFYWFMVQWNDTHLSEHSLYWRRFHMSAPAVDYPTTPTSPGDYAQLLRYTMIGNRDNVDYYSQLSDSLSLMIFNMEAHYSNLYQSASEAEIYLNNFQSGNTIGEQFYAKNILQMDVFYKALTDKSVIQQRAYEYPTLLGEVGGLMGLLLGASCITVFEVIDLFWYNFCVKCCDRQKRRKPKRNQGRYTIGSSTTRATYANNSNHITHAC